MGETQGVGATDGLRSERMRIGAIFCKTKTPRMYKIWILHSSFMSLLALSSTSRFSPYERWFASRSTSSSSDKTSHDRPCGPRRFAGSLSCAFMTSRCASKRKSFGAFWSLRRVVQDFFYRDFAPGPGRELREIFRAKRSAFELRGCYRFEHFLFAGGLLSCVDQAARAL